MGNKVFGMFGTKSFKYENQYEAKIKSQKVYINKVDRDGAQHLKKLKSEKEVTIEFAKEGLASYSKIMSLKEQDATTISSQPLPSDDKAKIGQWDLVMEGYCKKIGKKLKDVNQKIEKKRYEIAEKKESLEKEFENFKKFFVEGGAGD